MLYRCITFSPFYILTWKQFEDNPIANQIFKILEMTWQLIPTTFEYILLYLHLHTEF